MAASEELLSLDVLNERVLLVVLLAIGLAVLSLNQLSLFALYHQLVLSNISVVSEEPLLQV